MTTMYTAIESLQRLTAMYEAKCRECESLKRHNLADRAYANARYSELLKAHRELLATVKPARNVKSDTTSNEIPDFATMTEDQRIQWFKNVRVKA